ncbi:1-phosphatidylinositol phosphodiesterase [Ceratocystis platani]|uniref:1-phosphatidylinositol phosphodiesterase n=1 Tax=Ceratocystis fimbriata f. sp. platani TaxID=88771 RepID=A0A0F8B025_CERFI|nr:1-phosphatidylinositol phosphodiesterase [Ceratocystis platani]
MHCSFFTILASLAFSHAGSFNGIDDMWSFDLDEGYKADWMDTIEDDVSLTALSIPGTHNSMTDIVESDYSQTQNMPLDQQLIAGIRYIDISCRYTHHDMMIYNGRAATGYNLEYLLTTLFNFLHNHPREAIILRIQKGGILDSSKTFLESMKGHFGSDSEFDDRPIQYIYSRDGDEDTIPTLGQVRGKVLILQDFKSSPPGRYGILWNSNTVSSYNHRLAASTLLLNWRWDAIKTHLSRAQDLTKLRITHTTASAGVKPINFATSNYGDVGMNRLLGDYLSLEQGNCFGVVVMDFPGYRLVNQILKLNDDYQVPETDVFYSYRIDETTAEEFDFDQVYDGDTPPAEAGDDEVTGNDDKPFGLAK